MKRSRQREIAFHILYESQFQPKEPLDVLLNSYLEGFLEEGEEASSGDRSFIINEVEGTVSHLNEIDERIEECLVGWKLSRLSKVDLSILRLAIYELLFVEDIPERVSINEAVELAKNYSEETSGSFINGVLSNFAEKKD